MEVKHCSALLKSEIKKIESCHFRTLRIALRDYKQKISRDIVSRMTERLPPNSWSKLALCSRIMKIWYTNTPAPLYESIFKNSFTETRKQGRLFSYDSSKTRIGKNLTRNIIGPIMAEIQVPWTNADLNRDQIRILLKKAFTRM